MRVPFLRAPLLPALLVVLGACWGCGSPPVQNGPPSVVWSDVSEALGLPEGIQVFEGQDENAPLKAWMARVDVHTPGIDVQVVSSDDDDGRESVSDMVRDAGACLGVNGGYFLQNDSGFEHIGLLIADGTFVNPATPGVYVDGVRYQVRRSALGLDAANTPRIGWVSGTEDASMWWTKPIDNSAGAPVDTVDMDGGVFWDARDAVAAGPLLVLDGSKQVAADEEVFFHTTIPNVHPRTAAGIDEEGRLLLLVVDGRQQSSRGVDLDELADLMLDFGATAALNMDGGGSSTMIVRDALINRPAGATYQREVVSGIIVSCP